MYYHRFDDGGDGDGGGGQCLAENTLILTPEGYKKIQDLDVGDKVIGLDTEKDERMKTKVTRKDIQPRLVNLVKF